ncbi:phosphoenolpyruvate carboxykinase [ATP] 1 [Clostridium tetanomorphum]|nr:phosphoenolpyruvate carboxykinase [ATP] 1 [Clostridium tetanomorphum]
MNINLEYLGIKDCNNIYRNLPVSNLVEIAVERKEGVLCENGAFVVNTGKYTGRSPEDRFIVRQRDTEDKINWGKVNKSIDEEIFYKLYGEVMEYFKQKDIFIFDGFVGAMKQYTLPIRIVCEYAYQSLFAHQLFIRPSKEQLDKFNAEFTVIAAPGFKCKGKEDGVNSEAFVIINFDKK